MGKPEKNRADQEGLSEDSSKVMREFARVMKQMEQRIMERVYSQIDQGRKVDKVMYMQLVGRQKTAFTKLDGEVNLSDSYSDIPVS